MHLKRKSRSNAILYAHLGDAIHKVGQAADRWRFDVKVAGTIREDRSSASKVPAREAPTRRTTTSIESAMVILCYESATQTKYRSSPRRSVRCQRIGQPDLDVRIESGDEISDNKQWVRHKSGGPKGVAR